MALTTLDVVNDMLGLLGERRVNAIDEPHPLIPDALAKLDTASSTVQAVMWWFNVEYPTLTPQVGTGNLLVPNDTAACDSLTQYPRLAVRGNRLYNLDDVTDVFTDPSGCACIASYRSMIALSWPAHTLRPRPSWHSRWTTTVTA